MSPAISFCDQHPLKLLGRQKSSLESAIALLHLWVSPAPNGMASKALPELSSASILPSLMQLAQENLTLRAMLAGIDVAVML